MCYGPPVEGIELKGGRLANGGYAMCAWALECHRLCDWKAGILGKIFLRKSLHRTCSDATMWLPRGDLIVQRSQLRKYLLFRKFATAVKVTGCTKAMYITRQDALCRAFISAEYVLKVEVCVPETKFCAVNTRHVKESSAILAQLLLFLFAFYIVLFFCFKARFSQSRATQLIGKIDDSEHQSKPAKHMPKKKEAISAAATLREGAYWSIKTNEYRKQSRELSRAIWTKYDYKCSRKCTALISVNRNTIFGLAHLDISSLHGSAAYLRSLYNGFRTLSHRKSTRQ